MGMGDFLLRLPVVRPMVSWMSKSYQAAVESELRKFGLRYDDLLNEDDPEVKRAIENLPAEEQELRWKRLKRAMDLDLKKTYLHPDMAKEVDVWNPYIRDRIEVMKRERVDRQRYE
uniref:Cytochrome b-c1 complex subunit 7 n=1 Tax=Compsopogon caeruleus TaxID=31354 RepID=A0A7S1T6U0_9RHOD|mmetsp:Transcript_11917/g.24275  ORF Transcript_11917/g.24275 Transcript_11917/m.24275 type:complete len:116 (+) Transcript_11917:75-422(+)|eukprot:CAMPEP_0184687022 /NCGR_PEP_ID=MMETSP0312-20130426/24891_1 /TAXON_ID=31354 /ORGANISM="Compsopogon coeruleus, Strain SAG 36.94" /LENGTH=115 /DNA_ID=CAMNT_0027142715 /DNA_START=18 /DNA_END=365 /DNA_ORIENTATION=-